MSYLLNSKVVRGLPVSERLPGRKTRPSTRSHNQTPQFIDNSSMQMLFELTVKNNV